MCPKDKKNAGGSQTIKSWNMFHISTLALGNEDNSLLNLELSVTREKLALQRRNSCVWVVPAFWQRASVLKCRRISEPWN